MNTIRTATTITTLGLVAAMMAGTLPAHDAPHNAKPAAQMAQAHARHRPRSCGVASVRIAPAREYAPLATTPMTSEPIG